MRPKDPAVSDGRTHEQTANGTVILVAVRAGRGLVLDSIVTKDETWVRYFSPKTKRSSMQWRHTGSLKPKKAIPTSSVGKVMATIFCDSKDTLYLDFLRLSHN